MSNRNETVTVTLRVEDALEVFDVIAQARAQFEADLEQAKAERKRDVVAWSKQAVAQYTRVYDVLEAVVGSGTENWEAVEADEYEEDDLTADEATEAHTTFYDGVCEQCSTGLVVAVPCRLQCPDEATDDALSLDEVEEAIQAIEARTPGDKATCGHCDAPLSKGTLTDLLDLDIFEGTNVRGLCDACGIKASNSPHRIF